MLIINLLFTAITEIETNKIISSSNIESEKQPENESKIPPTLSSKHSDMPPPQDLPQTELAPRKRRRKRDDPQNCLTNSEVS